jgi:FkbM family methyltransferase
MRTEAPRILFYSHDGHGLGHLHLTLLLAEGLAERDPTASIVIATGAQSLDATHPPEGIELVKLPSVRAAARLTGTRPALGSGYRWRGLWAMREAILHETARTFDPHLVVGDDEPAGMHGELARTLRLIRDRNPAGKTVLGMNDCLGDAVDVVRRWGRDGDWESLTNDYDRVLVFGQPDVFDPRDTYEFPSTIAANTGFTGYLWRGSSATDPAKTRECHGISPAEPWIVVAAGGGEEGYPLISAAIAAAQGGITARFILVTGPLMPDAEQADLFSRRASVPHVSIVTSVDDPPACFAAADAVVINGGYNSVVEAIGAGKRPIIVPRDDVWAEQRQRAERLAELGLATCILPFDLTPERLATAVRDALAAYVSPPPLLHLDGVARAVNELLSLLPSPPARWPPRALPPATVPMPPRAADLPTAAPSPSNWIATAWDGTLFHVRPDDLIEGMIASSGAFERDVQQALFPWLRPGDVVIDAGANIGCHACPMAIRVAPHGRVVAIEPVGRLADRLEANCRLNGLVNVDIARVAVSSRAGRKRLVIPPDGVENQGVASFHREPEADWGALDVQTTTIDALVAASELTSVRLIKMDLEGEDLPALFGARLTLRRFRPIVAFEYHPGLWARAGYSLGDASSLLAGDLGYRMHPLSPLGEVLIILALP